MSNYPEFKPDYTPYEMFKEGIFQDWNGYWRDIYSNVAKKTIKNDYKQFDWGDLTAKQSRAAAKQQPDLPIDKLICNLTAKQSRAVAKQQPDIADPSKNKYGVPEPYKKC